MQVFKSKQIAIMIAVISCLGVTTMPEAYAHPHVWVTVKSEVLFDKQKAIIGFRHQWTFDEAYTSFAVDGLDKNNDGTYDREELKELTEINISSLKEFEYFTFPRLAGQFLKRLPPKDYWLEYHDSKLQLFFTLPLAQPLPIDKIKTFDFAVYDPSFYVDFELAKENPVKLTGAPAGCVPGLKKPASELTSQSLFDSDLSANDFAEQYATVISVKCPTS